MKLRYLTPFLFTAISASAQLTVTPGAEVFMNGDVPLAFHNTDLVNNGIFAGGINTISFTGNASSFIGGNGTLRFFRLLVNKTASKSVVLQRSIDVVSSISFGSGFFDLNGFNLDLETSGNIEGENNDNRIIGNNGGQVIRRTTLNAPLNSNPGNLGIQFTSDKDLGQVIIKRGHELQVGSGITSSILRYYEIVPAHNNNLNATLRFNYFTGELNGIDKNSLVVFEKDSATNWFNIGFSSRDVNNNFVERAGVDTLSRFTLSSATGAPLPVRFISFNISCNENGTKVTWSTAQEQSSNYFNIEKNNGASNWTVIGSLPAATGSAEKDYSFFDNHSSQGSLYRIAEYDLNGKVQYSEVVRSECSVGNRFSILPNPFNTVISLTIVAGNRSPAIIKMYDSKGALLKVHSAQLVQGSNQISLDLSALSHGVYLLEATWNNGTTKKVVQIIKQ